MAAPISLDEPATGATRPQAPHSQGYWSIDKDLVNILIN